MRGIIFVGLCAVAACSNDVDLSAPYNPPPCQGEGCEQAVPDEDTGGDRVDDMDVEVDEPDVELQGCEQDGDCVTPGVCKSPLGAVCVGGRCIYGALICDQPPEPACNEANDTHLTFAYTGECDPALNDCTYEVMVAVDCPECRATCASQCEALDCVDGNAGCLKGRCLPGDPAQCVEDVAPDGIACEGGFCLDGVCEVCTEDAQCDDNDPCTENRCLEGGCAAEVLVGGECRRMGEGKGVCDADGACVACIANSDCNDGEPCTVDTCVEGECRQAPLVCDDENPCTGDFCRNGRCNHPTDDNGVCDDGVCSGGSCVECRDNNQCSDRERRFCDTETNQCVGCIEDGQCPPFGECSVAFCNDNGLCRADVRALNGQLCEGGTGRCFVGACRECSERAHCPEQTPVCYQGFCRECGRSPVDCDDGNECTREVCSANTCYNHDDMDGEDCGEGGRCQGGICRE